MSTTHTQINNLSVETARELILCRVNGKWRKAQAAARLDALIAAVRVEERLADPEATIPALVKALRELADYSAGYDEYADFGLAERIVAARVALQMAGEK